MKNIIKSKTCQTEKTVPYKYNRERIRNRTRADNSKLFGTRRWAKTSIKEIKELNVIFPGRNLFSFISNPFKTYSNNPTPKKNIYINNTLVSNHMLVTGVPSKKEQKPERKAVKAKILRNPQNPRSLDSIPETIASWDFNRVVKNIDRYFLKRVPIKELRKLLIFSLDALKYALHAYQQAAKGNRRSALSFSYFFVVAKNYAEENRQQLNWKAYYA